MPNVAFAIAAHPDDIELMMAGTLLLLGQAGYELHVMNIANGSCGTLAESPYAIIERRREEARDAAGVMGAHFHAPLTNDVEIFYEDKLLRRVAAIIREVRPTILLLQSPQDYMEDHENAARLGATAAFVRGMPNYRTDPLVDPAPADVTVYHALPWGLRGPLGETVRANRYVDISSTLARKREALACHRSQKEWLDATQGLDRYLDTMEAMARAVGEQSQRYAVAEGWRRRLNLGYCSEHADPLVDALGGRAFATDENSSRQ
ncbi:MAG: PIG-L family deacetylase [Candidatus Hydrogenedentales bacterium]